MFGSIAAAASTAAPYVGQVAVASGKAVAGLIVAKKVSDYSFTQLHHASDQIDGLRQAFGKQPDEDHTVALTEAQEQKAS